MRLVGRTEHVVQLAHQVMHFRRSLERPFNRDAHGASRKVNGLLSSAPASDKVWCANGLIEAHRLSSETAKNIRLTGGSCRLVSPKVFFGAHNVLPHGQPLGRAARRLR